MPQEVGIHAIVPAQALQETPLDNAVALMPLSEVAAANGAGVELPSCSTRLAVTVDGTESDEQIAALKVVQKHVPSAFVVCASWKGRFFCS